jgi:hypothetical protein
MLNNTTHGVEPVKPDLDLLLLGGQDGQRIAVGDADDLRREVGGKRREMPEGEDQEQGKAFHARKIGQSADDRRLSRPETYLQWDDCRRMTSGVNE